MAARNTSQAPTERASSTHSQESWCRSRSVSTSATHGRMWGTEPHPKDCCQLFASLTNNYTLLPFAFQPVNVLDAKGFPPIPTETLESRKQLIVQKIWILAPKCTRSGRKDAERGWRGVVVEGGCQQLTFLTVTEKPLLQDSHSTTSSSAAHFLVFTLEVVIWNESDWACYTYGL